MKQLSQPAGEHLSKPVCLSHRPVLSAPVCPPGLLQDLAGFRGAAAGPAATCAADARARSAETCPGHQEGEQGAEEGDSQPQPGRGRVPRRGDRVCVKMEPSVFWKGSVCAVKCVWCLCPQSCLIEPWATRGVSLLSPSEGFPVPFPSALFDPAAIGHYVSQPFKNLRQGRPVFAPLSALSSPFPMSLASPPLPGTQR